MAEPRSTDETDIASTAHHGRRDPADRDESAREAAAAGVDPPRFAEAEPGRLADQLPVLDEDGEDRRQYTGEPVETDEGWVLPVQQNTGPGTTADVWAGPGPDGEASGGDTGDDARAEQERRARRPSDVAGGAADATPDPAG